MNRAGKEELGKKRTEAERTAKKSLLLLLPLRPVPRSKACLQSSTLLFFSLRLLLLLSFLLLRARSVETVSKHDAARSPSSSPPLLLLFAPDLLSCEQKPGTLRAEPELSPVVFHQSQKEGSKKKRKKKSWEKQKEANLLDED